MQSFQVQAKQGTGAWEILTAQEFAAAPDFTQKSAAVHVVLLNRLLK